MFTGIVSDVGEILEITSLGERRRLVVASGYDPASIEIGASVANAGVCLTVVGVDAQTSCSRLSFDVGAETLAVTTLGAWRAGGPGQSRTCRCELATSSAATWSAAMSTVSLKSFHASRLRRHGAFPLPRAEGLRLLYRRQGFDPALDGTSLTVNAVEGAEFEVLSDPAHARGDDLGRAQSGGPGQSRGRPDGALRGAAERGALTPRGPIVLRARFQNAGRRKARSRAPRARPTPIPQSRRFSLELRRTTGRNRRRSSTSPTAR